MEPTAEGLDREYQNHKVTIELATDEADVQEVGDLLRGLLLAWGFAPESVNEVIAPR